MVRIEPDRAALEIAHRLLRAPEGRTALALHLSRLAPPAPRPHHRRIARALLAEGGAVGRRFDFLVQEFVRETNTLCSKSASVPLTAVGLRLKAVIEQMREQVQNVE